MQMRERHATNDNRRDKASGDDRGYCLSQLCTCAELRKKLPHVLKFHEIFMLFVWPASNETLDVLKVSECLRAMGLDFDDSTLKACLVQRLLDYPGRGKPPKQVSFELVLSIYCELANSRCETLSLPAMLKGLNSKDIGSRNGCLPYGVLFRMLTTMGDRLNESDARLLLDSLKDENDNISSVTLLKTLFAVDSQAAEKLQQTRIYIRALGKNVDYMDMQKRDEFIKEVRRLDTNNTGFVAPDIMPNLLNYSGEPLRSADLNGIKRGMTNMIKKHADYSRFLRLIGNG